MIDKRIDGLVGRLSETHSEIESVIEGADLEVVVYRDTGWTIRDIIGHIAVWDRQVVKSISAYQAGSEYSIPNLDDDAFNQVACIEGRELTAEQIITEWDLSRQSFIEALRGLSPEQLQGELLYPWGDERGDVSLLVKYMTDHDIEHRDEIVQAIRFSEGS